MSMLAANMGGGGAQPTSPVGGIFGTVAPPITGALNDPGRGLSGLITGGIRIAILIAGFMLLFYLFYGAFLYISSGGEEEAVAKARNTMMYAVIGMILLIAGLGIFVVVAGNILHVIQFGQNGEILFKLPTVGP